MADLVAGSESRIIQAFTTNQHEEHFRWGFLLYCMEVAAGFRGIYELTVGPGSRPLGLAEPELRKRQAEASETVRKSTAQSYAQNVVFHDDVTRVLRAIEALQRASTAGLDAVTRERDALRAELQAKNAQIAGASAAAVAEIQKQLEAQKKENDARNAASGRELTATKTQLQTVTHELDKLKASQQLGDKVDGIQGTLAVTLQRLGDAETRMIDHLNSAAVAPHLPATLTDQIADYLRQRPTWAEVRHGVGNAELTALRAKAGEVDRVKNQMQDMATFIQIVKRAQQSIGTPATTVDDALIGNIRGSIDGAKLDGLPADSQGAFKTVAHIVIDTSIVIWTNREFKKQVDNRTPAKRWVEPSDLSHLVKNQHVRAIYSQLCPGNTGFQSVDQLKKCVQTLEDASYFAPSQTWTIRETVAQNLSEDQYTCLCLESAPAAAQSLSLGQDVTHYLMQNYLMLSLHFRMFHVLFVTLASDQEKLNLAVNYFSMIAGKIVPLPQNNPITQQADQWAQKMRLSGPLNKFAAPMLLMLQGYCVGGLFPDYLQLALSERELRELDPPLTMESIKDLADKLFIKQLSPSSLQQEYKLLMQKTKTQFAAPP